LLKII